MNRQPDLLLAGLVHDLKSVFETIGEVAELLSSDPQWAAVAGTIERAVKQGSRITTSFQESVTTFDLDIVLRNAILCTQDFVAASHRPTVQFRRDVETGLRLAGRPGAWERVFVNLFLNSSQASRGPVDIEIQARRGPGGVEILVSDTGSGISDDILPRIFQPGFSTSGRRTGMGLAIVESIVSAYDGAVEAGNRPGVAGAQFRITVPDSQVVVAAQPHPVSSEGLADTRMDECA